MPMGSDAEGLALRLTTAAHQQHHALHNGKLSSVAAIHLQPAGAPLQAGSKHVRLQVYPASLITLDELQVMTTCDLLAKLAPVMVLIT